MKLESGKLFLATMLAFGLLYVVCAIFVLLIPVAMMGLTGGMMHMDTGGMVWSMGWGNLIIGLVAWIAAGRYAPASGENASDVDAKGEPPPGRI